MSNLPTSYKPSSGVSDAFAIAQYFLTSVDLGSGFWGFFTGFGGSISPTTLAGFTITHLYTFPTATTLLQVSGSAPQALFTSITIGDTTRLAADAVYFNNGSETFWSWTATNVLDGVTGQVPVSIA